MADAPQEYLKNIPLPTDKQSRHSVAPLPDFFRSSNLSRLFGRIELDDIILIGLVILLLTETDCDYLLLVLIGIILLAGFD